MHETSLYLCKLISREVVSWAMNEVRKDAAPGMDDVVMDMMVTERLFEVWVALFEFCWECGRVLSLWRECNCPSTDKARERSM